MSFSSMDTIWVLVGGALVFFMNAGFAMLETGFTRAKNAGNIIMKNLMDYALGTLVFWFVGFGLMYAGSRGLFGGVDFFARGALNDWANPVAGSYESISGLTISPAAFLFFQTVFCATAATIVSGAMAERTKFSAYCIYSAVISAVIYPVSGHWIWGGGWLSQMGFVDFAGSTAVHMTGGIAALVGAFLVGPRVGKYGADGKPRAIPGHSLTLGALGVFVLWFAWFGFNGASTLGIEGYEAGAGNVFLNTNLSAAAAAATVMGITWVRYKKPDVSMTLNGALAGLVAVTAGCYLVDVYGAFCIGVAAGFAVVFGIEFVDKKLKIDDPVGAVGVHGICGALGTLLTGLFAAREISVNGATRTGLFYGGGFYMLGVQALGIVSVAAWVGVTVTGIFLLIKKTVGLRVSDAEQIGGLDIHEHNLESSYADFMPAAVAVSDSPAITVAPKIRAADKTGDGHKMTKVTVITKPERFGALKNALEKLGVTGLTLTDVRGFGMQKGVAEYYRGVPVEATLLPKIKVEIVVCKIPVPALVETIKGALHTGNIGDGKIFVYDAENVIKVRTGEQGYDALQDD